MNAGPAPDDPHPGGNATAGLLELHLRQGHPDFLDMPWAIPVGEWDGVSPRIVELPRGISRHEVRFAAWNSRVYAFKQLGADAAEREYERLVELEARRLPVVTPAGWALAQQGPDARAGVLITRFLDGALPYRVLFGTPGLQRYSERLIDALAGLLVRLHLAGVYWGDCSLSNTLFRRDAGELGAYLVDAETAEAHDTLSDARRVQDLEIMDENVAGELADVEIATGLPSPLQEDDAPQRIRQRYDALWAETAREEVVAPGDAWRIHERVRSLNALGFSVGEIELVPTADGSRLRVRTLVTDREYHRHRLHDLTGIVAEERQAQLLLNDIRELRAQLVRDTGRSVSLGEAAFRWQNTRWEPTRVALRPLVRAGGDLIQLYCQVLEHKWFLSERARRDVGLEAAVEDYLRAFAAGA